MDTPLNFTLRYSDATNDQTDKTGDVGTVGTNGVVLFEPTVREGARIVTTDGTLTPRTFECYMENGVLKTEPGVSSDVRLWGNDPDWNLARYSYRVRAVLADATGVAVSWLPFEFDAPSVDAIKYLKDYMPLPGQKFGRGVTTRIIEGSASGDGLTFQNDDGSSFVVEVPTGTLAFIDNGDSTWSVIG